MQTKEDIFEELKKILADLFEIDETAIKPEAKLYEELDLDSIDAIDLIMKLQTLTGKKVKPEEFKKVRTVQDTVDVIYRLLQKPPGH